MKVSIEKVVKDKLKHKSKYIPTFIIRLLEKIICQKQINNALDNIGHLRGLEFISELLKHMGVSIEVSGLENLEGDSSYIIASNHPLGGLDGIALADVMGKHNADTKLVVNDILMTLEPIKELFIPINKHGRQSAKYATQFSDVMASGAPVLYFPAGLCSRMVDGKITDLVWHPSFVKKALEYKRDIVPVYVDDRNSNFFYKFAQLRVTLKLKFNIEMILLPSEMFRRRKDRAIRVIIGERITYSQLTSNNYTVKEICDNVRAKCYSLAQK